MLKLLTTLSESGPMLNRGFLSTAAAIPLLVIGLAGAGYLLLDIFVEQQSIQARTEARSLAQEKIEELRRFDGYNDLLRKLNPGMGTSEAAIASSLPVEGHFPKTAEKISGQYSQYERQWSVTQEKKSTNVNVTVSWRDGLSDQAQSESAETSFIWAANVPTIQPHIQTIGKTSDGKLLKVITGVASTSSITSNIIDKPLTVRGPVLVGEAAVTIHNPKGHSTIWSGGPVKLGSNSQTMTRIPDPSDRANYPDCLWDDKNCNLITASTKDSLALDVVDRDHELAQMSRPSLFASVFGLTLDQYKNKRVDVFTKASNISNVLETRLSSADKAAGKVIWIEGDVALQNMTLGCDWGASGKDNTVTNENCLNTDTEYKPFVLIVNGKLTLKGDTNLFGFVYVNGDLISYGHNRIEGALIVANTAQLVKGSVDIRYDASVKTILNKKAARIAAAGNGS